MFKNQLLLLAFESLTICAAIQRVELQLRDAIKFIIELKWIISKIRLVREVGPNGMAVKTEENLNQPCDES